MCHNSESEISGTINCISPFVADWVLKLLTIESTHKGVNQRSKDVTQTQQQRAESPTVTLTWHASKYKVRKLRQSYILNACLCFEDVTLVEFRYFHNIQYPQLLAGVACQVRVTVGDSGLCCLFDGFQALINSFVCGFCTSALGLVLFQIVSKYS